MGTLGWARCIDSVADVMRRGAWYPILEETGDGHVVLDVHQRKLRLSRQEIRVRKDQPSRWSIVVRTGVLRPTLGGGRDKEITTTYAVCPHCQERQDFTGKPAQLGCARCGKDSEVDWSETC
jgi:hypothetical protein